MITISRSLTVEGATSELWPRLVDAPLALEGHPMVQALAVIEQGQDRRRTRWELLLRGSVLHLILHEEFDHDRREVTARQVAGDLATFGGTWSVGAGGDTIDVNITASFGLPLAGEIIDYHLQRTLNQLFDDVKPALIGR